MEVDEPNSSTATVTACPQVGDPIAVTTYTYDVLGNLMTVTQSGSRQRSFVHDSLSRLTSGSNPETGGVTYTYDADGNMLSKQRNVQPLWEELCQIRRRGTQICRYEVQRHNVSTRSDEGFTYAL